MSNTPTTPKSPKKKRSSKQPAAKQLSLPTPTAIVGQGDPAFAELRRHHAAFRAGVSVVMGAGVAMGAEIARLRAEIKPSAGGDQSKSNTVAFAPAPQWRDLVKTQSGVSYEHARRAEKVAVDLLNELSGKRDKDSVAARRLLAAPSKITEFAHYELLSRVVGRTYDADTWHGLLVEVGIIRRPVEPAPSNAARIGDDPDPHQRKLALDEEARVLAKAWLESLRGPIIHREQWRQRLSVLPVDPTGDPDQPSLADLKAELSDHLTEIDEIILRKQSAS